MVYPQHISNKQSSTIGTDLESVVRFVDPIRELSKVVLVLRRLKKPSDGATAGSFREFSGEIVEFFDEGLKVASKTLQFDRVSEESTQRT